MTLSLPDWLLVSVSSEHCRAVIGTCDLSHDWRHGMTYKEIETDFASDLEIVTHLTIPDELRNSNYDIEDLWGDWQSENALDSIRNSCEVYIFPSIRSHFLANRLRDLMFGEPVPRTPCPICRFTNGSKASRLKIQATSFPWWSSYHRQPIVSSAKIYI